MCSPIATAVLADLQNPPNSDEALPVAAAEKDSSSKIRLVRWFSSYKQVFIAELLVRSTGQDH
ncbi:MAG TPA: hypothetical protein VFB76_18700 [Candidatus Angelobacter sp.]|nr:hypothetical protein [Candidatus Angelobacter sp.]